MEIFSIALKNNLLLFQDLSDDTIEKYIQYESQRGKVKKYPFNIFYSISEPNNYIDKTLEEIYDYSLRNFLKFFEHFENEYSKDDIQNFALSFTLDNYHFTIEDISNLINFIDEHFIESDSEKEIIKWCQNKIKLFKLYIYSYDIENYRNGTITNLLKDLEDITNNYKEDLIYEIQINSADE